MIMAMTYLRLHLFSLTLKPPASSGELSDYDYDSFSSPVFGCEAPPSILANITALVHLKSKITSPCSTLLSYLEMYKSFDHIDPTLLQMSHDDLDRACSETNQYHTQPVVVATAGAGRHPRLATALGIVTPSSCYHSSYKA